jgi:integrase
VLGKRVVDAAAPREVEYQIFDGEIPGLALRVNPSGRKVYALYYRTAAGRKRNLTLGRHGSITPEQARRLAKERLAEVTRGGDPSGDSRRARQASDMAALVERYRAEHLAFKKASTRARAEGLLKRIILPALGRMKAEAITRADILALHRVHRERPVEANRAVTLLSGIYTWAEDGGLALPQGNPCRRVKKHAERRRERYLSAQELARLGAALARAEQGGTESPAAIFAIRLLLLTGCRKGEVLGLRWEDVDLGSECLRLTDSKTGAKTVPLGAPALQLLTTADRSGPWVCPGGRAGEPLKNLYKPWGRICQAAGITGVRPHDMRHSYVSAGAAEGESLVIVGAIVGHSAASMTERYAHLSDDPVRAAADRISSAISAAMSSSEGAEVRPMRGRPRRVRATNRRPSLEAGDS